MFQAQCPLCKILYHAHNEWNGRQAICPHCHQTIIVQQSMEQQTSQRSTNPNSTIQSSSNVEQMPYTSSHGYDIGFQQLESRIARIDSRFIAWLVDNIILFIINFILKIILGFVLDIVFNGNPHSIKIWSIGLAWILGAIVLWSYEALFLSRYGATPGKRLFNLKVLHNGQYLMPMRAIMRSIGRNVSTIIIFIGFIIAFLNKEHNAFHDMLCDTVVVEE